MSTTTPLPIRILSGDSRDDFSSLSRSLAFACMDFDDAVPGALLQCWITAAPARRAAWMLASAPVAHHFGAFAAAKDRETFATQCAKQGHLRWLRWSLEAHKTVCQVAAEHGHLDCLMYAREQGCRWDASACSAAAWNGHLACLMYAHEQGCRWDASACSAAAWNGHLDCLMYAHEQGCTWDADTCYAAVWNGHLDCLMYAHEQGCTWDASTCLYAAQNGHLDCLMYAHEQGCTCDATACYAIALLCDRVGCVLFLRQLMEEET